MHIRVMAIKGVNKRVLLNNFWTFWMFCCGWIWLLDDFASNSNHILLSCFKFLLHFLLHCPLEIFGKLFWTVKTQFLSWSEFDSHCHIQKGCNISLEAKLTAWAWKYFYRKRLQRTVIRKELHTKVDVQRKTHKESEKSKIAWGLWKDAGYLGYFLSEIRFMYSCFTEVFLLSVLVVPAV